MKQRELSIAKITRPRLAGVYERKRLFKLLDQGRASPVVWISGPAGSGKTTLAASWLDSRKLPSLWYQLDEGDGDIATFFYYLGLAARKSAPRFRRPLPLLTPEYAFGIPVFTRRFFEELFNRLNPHSLPFDKRGVRGGFVVVFDNYHHIPEASPLHEIMKTGLSTVPEGVTVIISSRAEPPAAFSGLRANAQMEVIGWDALRLTPEESRGIIRLEKGRHLPAGAVTSLHQKAGGWAAGLILMANGTGTVAETRADGALRPEETFDYFASELFDKAEKPVREFLLRTAVLPKITPSMAEELTKNRNAGTILAGLNRRNYFTEKRDDSGPTYQYHPLFRHFLVSGAKSAFSVPALADLYRAGARLLEPAGWNEDAAELYLLAGDADDLARLILRRAREMFSQGRSKTLHEWLSGLPEAVKETSPWLLYWEGMCRFLVNYAESRRYFERALRAFETSKDMAGVSLAWSAAVDTVIYEFGNLKQLEPWTARFKAFIRKRHAFPSAEVEFRAVTSMTAALMFSGKGHDEIAPWVERGMRLMHACPDRNVLLQSSVYFALFYLWLGELSAMAEIMNEQKRWIRAAGVTPLSRAAANFIEALYHWITAAPDFGADASTAGLAVSAAHGIHTIDNHLIAQKLIGALAKGDLAMAEELFSRIESMTAGSGKRYMINYHYFYLSAWKSLLAGDFSAAWRRSLDSLRLLREMGGSAMHRVFSTITTAQALLCLGHYDEAHPYIREVHRIASDVRSPLFELSGLLLEAQYFFGRGGGAGRAGAADSAQSRKRKPGGTADTGRGIAVLRRALALGRSRGYLNTIAWYGPPVARLCAIALEQGIEVEYVRRLIAAHRLQPDPGSRIPENWPWPVKMYALGRFRIEVDGKPLEFSGKVRKKPLEMLKALIAFGGSDVPEDRISEALWPGAEGDTARISFKTTIHRLRQLIGNDEILDVADGRVSLARQYCWTDVRAFEELIESAECGMRGADSNLRKSESARHQLPIQKAIGLYKGHFLSGEDGPWSVSARERLRRKYLAAALMLGEALERARDYRAAIASYEQALEMDDLTEELYRRLMACHLKLGRKADAVKAYERCRRTLAAGLGVEPSEETEALYRSLLRK